MSEEIGGGRGAGYRVRIVYSEPGFRRKNPHCPAEYSSVFDVPQAPSYDAAVREAMAQWDDCVRYSGVGWLRVIKSVTVES
jgi:hypothetical protein